MKRLLTLLMALAMVSCPWPPAAAPASGTLPTPAIPAPPLKAGRPPAPPAWRTACLTIAMECAYAPYNWSQSDDSNGAVPISNVPGTYANGYDVMIAKQICEANGWELEDRSVRLGLSGSRRSDRHL